MQRMVGNVGFEEDIRPLFRQDDRDCMLAASFPAFDLWDWTSVRQAGTRILARLAAGDMPPDAPWPESQVDVFRRWLQDGAPKRRGATYAGFFRDLDSYTEYDDVYRPDIAGKYMTPIIDEIFGKVLGPWRSYASARSEDRPQREQQLRAILHQPSVRQAVELVDTLMVDLVKQHFSDGQGVDRLALIEAQLLFGADRLPLDAERDARIGPKDGRKPFAKFHRMDGAVMWFNWAAHIESSVLVRTEADVAHPVRVALMAGVCGGSGMDFTFRDQRLPTRPEYKRDDATERVIRASANGLASWIAAVGECHMLWKLVSKPLEPNKFFGHAISAWI